MTKRREGLCNDVRCRKARLFVLQVGFVVIQEGIGHIQRSDLYLLGQVFLNKYFENLRGKTADGAFFNRYQNLMLARQSRIISASTGFAKRASATVVE